MRANGGQLALLPLLQAPRRRTPRSRPSAAVSAADARDIPSGSAPRPAARRGPARPATCTIVCASRSPARKSALNRPWSAFSTTTSVTFGKSWPLVSICVPTRMRTSLAVDARQRRFQLALAAHAVAVDARQRRVRKQLSDRFLDALRALSDRLRRLAAVRAQPRAAVAASRSDGRSACARGRAPSGARRSAGSARTSRRPDRTAPARSRGD